MKTTKMEAMFSKIESKSHLEKVKNIKDEINLVTNVCVIEISPE